MRETTTANHYEIIAGERRWRAAQLAGLSSVPCLMGNYSDEQAAAITLIENIQRENLNLLEEAKGYQRLINEFHFKQEEVASLIGKSRSHIANLLRLLTLSEPVQTLLSQNRLSLGHARMLVGLSDRQQQLLAKQVIAQEWSVRRLEEEVRAKKTSPEPTASQQHNLDYLQNLIAEQVGAPVLITPESNQSGWLKIKFFDNDTLSGLLERLGLRYD